MSDDNVIALPSTKGCLKAKRKPNSGSIKPGEVRNPNGRVKGSRNKLQTKFFDQFYARWEKDGEDIFERLTAQDPKAMAQIAASLMPKQTEVGEVGDFDEMTLPELEAFVKSTLKGLKSA